MVVCNLHHLSFVVWWIQDASFFCQGLLVQIPFSVLIIWQGNWRWRFQFRIDWCSETVCLVPAFLMISTLLIHMWSNSVAKLSPPSRGACLDRIWSKSTAWQSPPTRGIFRTTFGQSPQWDKVLQWGAHFGPRLVKVCSETESSNKRHILDHFWLKSTVRQSPPTRGTFWTTFDQSPQWDKVLQQGAHSGPHLVKVCSKTKSSNKGHHLFAILGQCPLRDKSSDEGHHFLATFGLSPLCDTSFNKGQIFFLCQTWATPAAWYATLITHPFTFWMPIAWASQPTPPTWPLFPRGPTSRELQTKFSSLTISWIVWLGASKPIPYLSSRLSIRDLYVLNSFMPLRSISTLPATLLPSLETLPTKMGQFSLIKIDVMSIHFFPYIKDKATMDVCVCVCVSGLQLKGEHL